jgi:hypothetical protein
MSICLLLRRLPCSQVIGYRKHRLRSLSFCRYPELAYLRGERHLPISRIIFSLDLQRMADQAVDIWVALMKHQAFPTARDGVTDSALQSHRMNTFRHIYLVDSLSSSVERCWMRDIDRLVPEFSSSGSPYIINLSMAQLLLYAKQCHSYLSASAAS